MFIVCVQHVCTYTYIYIYADKTSKKYGNICNNNR